MKRAAAEPVENVFVIAADFTRSAKTAFLNGLLTKHSTIRKTTYPDGVTIPSLNRRSIVLVSCEKQNRFTESGC
jgi:hypothetical protein